MCRIFCAGCGFERSKAGEIIINGLQLELCECCNQLVLNTLNDEALFEPHYVAKIKEMIDK